MHTGLAFISFLIAANVVRDRLRPKHDHPPAGTEFRGVRVAVILWTAGYAAVGLLAMAPAPLPLAGLVIFAVMVAAGRARVLVLVTIPG